MVYCFILKERLGMLPQKKKKIDIIYRNTSITE